VPTLSTKYLAIRAWMINNLNENCSYLQKDYGMTRITQRTTDPANAHHGGSSEPVAPGTPRIKSEDLFQQQREIEIDHQGRIYRLRLTQLNKLILTA
jgi:hemin uptake protein HemP